MSVPEQVPYKEYRATGSNNSFEITFYLPDPKDLVVMVNKEIPPVGAYSIVGDSIVFGVAPNEGDLFELTRDTQLDRETEYKSYDNSFRPETINFDLDKIWLVLQESNLVDAKILARLKQEIEWRRTHDFNYDELAQVREKQLFDALKSYTDTMNAATHPGIFQGVIAGVVFARDGKSIQTHLEEILEALDQKASKVDTYTKPEVDTALSAVAAGHKAYTTLALAQAAQGTLPVNSIVEVTNDPTDSNNGTYQWDGTTLTKSAYDPLTQAKADATEKANTAKNDAVKTIINESSNIFNDATSIKENKLISATGEIIESKNATDWAYSDFITIEPNQNYFYDGFRHIAYYDNERNFIERVDSVVTGNGTFPDPYKFTGALLSPTNAYFIRVNYRTQERTDHTDINRKINKGNSVPYEDFSETLKESIKVKKDDQWVFGSKNIEDDAISVDKVDFIKKSANLFNADACIVGKVISIDGIITDSSTYAISDFIAVESGQKYTMSSSDVSINAFIHIASYNSNKEFINRTTTQTGDYTFTIPPNVAFIRLNINTNTGAVGTKQRMLNAGDVAIPYQSFFKPFLNNITISDSEKVEISLQAQAEIQPEIYTLNNKTSVISQSNNLFNHTDCLLDHVIRDTGAIESTTSGYSVSNFIAVESGQKYTISSEFGYNAFIHTAYYDVNKNFIVRNTTTSDISPRTLTIPPNVAFVRFNLNNGRPDERSRMFNSGDTALPFEFYGFKLSDIILGDDIIAQISNQASPSGSKFVYDLPVHDIFETDATWTEFSNFRTITAAEVYQMYDDLMEQHPSNITKHMLASNAAGQEIAYYKFKPTKVTGNFTTKIPKVFLCCSVHGMEHTPPLATFLMLREMYNNWQSSPLLEALRFNAEFIVIPVANPYGWDIFNRLNPNGVDINRNFPVGWAATESEGSPFWQGVSPASEIETQNIMSVFEDVKDIDIFYDFHNFNGTIDETQMIWVSPIMGDEYMARMSEAFVSRMTRIWRKKYEFIPPEPYFAGRVSTSNTGGMIKNYAGFIGTKFAATFEFCGQWWIDPSAVPHDIVHKRTTMEALTNWILINLNELKQI